MNLTRPEWIWSGLACAVGLLAASLALRADDLQFAVLFLFIQCAVFGYAQPERAWRWAALIAIWIPLSLLFNLLVSLPGPRELGYPARLFLGPLVVFFRSPTPVRATDILPSFLAFAPAICGAYLGAWMSRVAAPVR